MAASEIKIQITFDTILETIEDAYGSYARQVCSEVFNDANEYMNCEEKRRRFLELIAN